jgi:hypothetical protein
MNIEIKQEFRSAYICFSLFDPVLYKTLAFGALVQVIGGTVLNYDGKITHKIRRR